MVKKKQIFLSESRDAKEGDPQPFILIKKMEELILMGRRGKHWTKKRQGSSTNSIGKRDAYGMAGLGREWGFNKAL